MLDGFALPVLIGGHTHLQMIRRFEESMIVNPGSVGLPFDGDRRAAYALWRGGGDFELRRVSYDSDAYAAAIRGRMGEALGDTVATLVRRVTEAAFV